MRENPKTVPRKKEKIHKAVEKEKSKAEGGRNAALFLMKIKRKQIQEALTENKGD